jgi:hypothetical protein
MGCSDLSKWSCAPVRLRHSPWCEVIEHDRRKPCKSMSDFSKIQFPVIFRALQDRRRLTSLDAGPHVIFLLKHLCLCVSSGAAISYGIIWTEPDTVVDAPLLMNHAFKEHDVWYCEHSHSTSALPWAFPTHPFLLKIQRSCARLHLPRHLHFLISSMSAR